MWFKVPAFASHFTVHNLESTFKGCVLVINIKLATLILN